MNLGDLKAQFRLDQPDAKRLADADLIRNFNRATVDIVRRLKLIRTDATFDVVANQDEYKPSAIAKIEDFLLLDGQGLHWKNLNSQFQKLEVYTPAEMDDRFRNWRDEPASNPIRYFFKPDIFTVHPKPNASLVDGFRLYYIAKPPLMVNDGDFPFGGTNEAASFEELDEAILAYINWKTRGILGKTENRSPSDKIFEDIYIRRVEEAGQRINRRPDLQTSNQRSRMRIRGVGHGGHFHHG